MPPALEARNELIVWAHGEEKYEQELVGPWLDSWMWARQSQRVFRVSLDGERLGYVTPAGDLRVRQADGIEHTVEGVNGRDWRFSPDGRHVAVVTGKASHAKLVVLDVDEGNTRTLGDLNEPDRVEWTRNGVVVRERQKGTNLLQLTYFPLDGKPRKLVERERINRFATASRGSRVFFAEAEEILERSGIFQIDVDTDAAPVKLGRVRGAVLNAEAAPDGSRVAFASTGGVYVYDGDELRRVSRDESVSTLWFSPDGQRILFMSPKRATILDGDARRELDRDGSELVTARFVPGTREVLIAAGAVAYRWNPDEDRREVVATASQGEEIVAADWFGEDLVLWTQRRE